MLSKLIYYFLGFLIGQSPSNLLNWELSSTWTPVGAEVNGTMAIQALVERRLPKK